MGATAVAELPGRRLIAGLLRAAAGARVAFAISLTHSRARGADDRGRRRRDASYRVIADSTPVQQLR